jgi:photosystem II stability/assembly factor-like uncharacterized protein
MELIMATDQGVVTAVKAGKGWRVRHRSLEGQQVTCIIAREGVILAGTRRGVFRSADGGQDWQAASQGLDIPHIRWLAFHPQVSDWKLAGTEPAGIYLSQDGANTWQACPEVAEMRRQYGWSLPYSPEAGCVRGFALLGERAYAAVEVGGVLVSEDRGQHWVLAGGSRGRADFSPAAGHVHSDVHSLAVHPSDPNLVFAPTGGGLYRSEDGGVTWALLYRCYCRAILLDPQDPAHLVFGPAEGVDRSGSLVESLDGGQSWQAADDGLETPWANTMVERFARLGEHRFAVLSDGRLFTSPTEQLSWQPALSDVAGINAVTTMVD